MARPNKKVTVTLPPTTPQNIKVYWQRRDGKPGNSPLFPGRQKDVAKADCLRWLGVLVDPELVATGEGLPSNCWVVVHLPTHKRFFWETEPLRLPTREAALGLAALLEEHFDWNFDGVGMMDEWMVERAKALIGRWLRR